MARRAFIYAVSRVKTGAGKSAVREGFELSCENSEQSDSQSVKQAPESGYTQIRAQIPDALGRDLSLVVAFWSKLSPPLKAAILAIILSSTAATEGES